MATSEAVQGGPPLVHPPTGPSNQSQPLNDSSNDESQDTTASHDTDRVFTPPGSDSGSSLAAGNGNTSSQESQLLQLSQLAAAQEKMVETGVSKKRMADGMVKHSRNGSLTSPVRMGHSRNTSTVSVASTATSRMSEVKNPNPCREALGIYRVTDHQTALQLSAELKTKLSYAMLKVNNGWQSHSIDEVESLASQAASPTSSSSTLHGRHGASASPRVALPGGTRQGIASTGISPISQVPPGRTYESLWRESNTRPRMSASPPKSQLPALAPPASIQPRQPGHLNPRRNSNVKYTPAFLSPSNQGSPHTPAQPSPLQSTPGTYMNRTPNMDPLIFSPHQNVREQEALETLVFMSSPGNSANLKHAFPSSHSRNGAANTHRTALPGSRLGPGTDGHQVRKSLPTGRQAKRVGFEKSPNTVDDMDMEEAYGSPQIRGTPRRKTIGSKPSLSVPAGLSGPSRSRPALQDDDIERMLDRVAADDSSDSDSEIALPQSRRHGSAGVIGA
ncbi:hypothetical protein PG985_004658 [Apiospora marii]|uniref:Uncharacterized protein n=1 Tax=Apiospora marii TaxID=335849 RepID=A0ABR1SA05_9PEZI